jgi:hypothetical protein
MIRRHRKLANGEAARLLALSPSPRDWGLSVTIGIALRPFAKNDFIVTVSDLRISVADSVGAVDVAMLKDLRIDRYWGFLAAADDMGYVLPIRDKAMSILCDVKGRHTLSQASDALINAYHSVREPLNNAGAG